MSTFRFFGSVLASAVLCTPAAAEPFPSSEPYLALHAGPLVSLGTWNLGSGTSKEGLRPASTVFFHGGGKLGWQVDPRLAVEGGLFFAPLRSTDEAYSLALSYEIDGLYHLTAGDVTPYALVGIGGYHVVSGDLAADFDPAARVGLGVRGMVAPGIALRGGGRLVLTDGFTSLGSTNAEVRVGIDIWPSALGPADGDGDGISDADDACPAEPGVASGSGCPDRDGDGVVDSADRCVSDPGTVEGRGCPDRDGDQIYDADDSCPDVAGVAALGGCPDSDGDGVGDGDDACPSDAGSAALQGCPDRDGDKIQDAQDACPDEPGSVDGCPDRDKDGVADKDDACPDIRGLVDHDGCVPEEVQAFTGAVEGITFQSGSATIRPASYPTLDAAAAVMQEFDSLRLRVEGHTDSQGDEAANMALSAERATAVVAYLTERGISADRLASEGFGETRPVADNGTAAGRAQNRRIEFVIVER